MRWEKLFLFLQSLLIGYFLLIELISVFPWNDLDRAGGVSIARTLFIVAPLIVALLAVLGRNLVFMVVGAFFQILWFAVQLGTIWFPYFLGANKDVKSRAAVLYERTYKFLPPVQDHPIPDAANVVLFSLTIIAIGSLIFSIFEKIIDDRRSAYLKIPS